MYLCLYHLPHVYCTLVPEICVCPDKLHVFRYIYMLTCVIYNCIRLNSKVDWMLATHSLTVHLFNWWSANSLSNCLTALYSDSKLLLAWQFDVFFCEAAIVTLSLGHDHSQCHGKTFVLKVRQKTLDFSVSYWNGQGWLMVWQRTVWVWENCSLLDLGTTTPTLSVLISCSLH